MNKKLPILINCPLKMFEANLNESLPNSIKNYFKHEKTKMHITRWLLVVLLWQIHKTAAIVATSSTFSLSPRGVSAAGATRTFLAADEIICSGYCLAFPNCAVFVFLDQKLPNVSHIDAGS